jgi:prepilin-type processing-associated H-X9-DG protein
LEQRLEQVGSNLAFADGSVRLLTYAVGNARAGEGTLLQALVTPDGGEAAPVP